MKITAIELVNVLYRTIENRGLFSSSLKPTGMLCKYEQPLNSTAEDVVINDLGLDREDVQEGVLNVNIFVPNLKLPDKQNDKFQPNTKRLLELSKLFNSSMGYGDDIWDQTGKWCFNIQQDTVIADPNKFQHYINFRIEFYLNN